MAYRQGRFPGARRVLAQDAVDRYDLRRTLMARLMSDHPSLTLLLLFGDVELDELDLDPRAGENPTPGMARAEPEIHGLIVAGNLLVNGAIHQLTAPMGMSLYVLGGLRARNVAVTGLEIVVRGSLAVDQVFAGHGPQGGARLDGGVAAKLLVSDGFPMLIGGRLAAPVLDTGRTRIGLVEGTTVREALGDAPPGVVLDEALRPAEGQRFDFGKLRAAVQARRPVLAPDYLSGKTDLVAMRELRRLDRSIESAMASGRYSTAAAHLRAARARGAPKAETALRLADAIYRTHHSSGDRESLGEALELLNETLGPQPDPDLVVQYPQALVQRAAILLQLHEHDDRAFELAWHDCGLAAVALPATERPGIAGLMGQWLFSRRRYEDAVPYLREALGPVGGDGVLHGRLARALWMLDREAEALPHASRSLQLNPTDDRMWFVRGKCHQVVGNITEARLDLQTYLELHADDQLAAEALVEIGLDQGHHELAVERALAFVTAHEDMQDAASRFGRLMHTAGAYEAAIPFTRRALEADPESRQTVVDLAVELEEVGGVSRGLTTALRLLEVDLSDDHLAYLRAECFLALDEKDRAAIDLEGYLVRFPDSPRALASLASIRASERRTEDAEKLLITARAQAPDDDYVQDVAERAGLARSDSQS